MRRITVPAISTSLDPLPVAKPTPQVTSTSSCAGEAGRSLFDHVRLVQDLQDLLGVKVQIGTAESLHWYVRDAILHDAKPL